MLIASSGTCTHPEADSATLVFPPFFRKYSCSFLVVIKNNRNKKSLDEILHAIFPKRETNLHLNNEA